LSDIFPIHGLKQGDALSPLLFNLVLENAINIQTNQERLIQNGTHHLPVFADDNLSDESIHTVQNNTEVSLLASKDAGRQKILIKLSTRLMSLEKECNSKSHRKASQYIP
jgi:hypothetical protein